MEFVSTPGPATSNQQPLAGIWILRKMKGSPDVDAFSSRRSPINVQPVNAHALIELFGHLGDITVESGVNGTALPRNVDGITAFVWVDAIISKGNPQDKCEQ